MPTSTRGRLASKKRSRGAIHGARLSRGLSLIELMVTMAIVGLMFVVAATGLRSAFSVNLKSSSAKLASTLRYLSNKAVTEHRYLRVVYDIDGQAYRVEESEEPFVVSSQPEEASGKAQPEKTTTETEGPPKEGEEGELADASEKNSGFSEVESSLIKPVKLPSGVFFKDISVSYLDGKIEQGQAYTYFFPNGFATPTVINLRDEDDQEHYSLELFPLSGRVRIEGEYKERLTSDEKGVRP